MTLYHPLACPLDRLNLQLREHSLVCAQGHCFDLDRRGAVNLLPVQFKSSLEPGDSKEMVQARQDFLNGGFYQPVADFLCRMVADHVPQGTILDAGCGEGYYTAQLAARDQVRVIGMDISKPAIQAASRRAGPVTWVVGTNKNIPVQDHALDMVVCLFGFPVWEEFARVLKPGGKVLLADPGAMHLIEMRRILYPEIREKKLTEKTTPGFDLLDRKNLVATIVPPPPDMLAAQLMMTPHHFRAQADKRQQAIEAQYEGMTLDVAFSLYQC